MACTTILTAQQPGPANPAIPNAPNRPEIQNPPVRLQPNQQGLHQRAAQRQNFPPFVNRNPRDPREEAEFERQQAQGQGQGQGQHQGLEGFDSGLYGSSYSSGGGGGVVTAEQGRGLAVAEVLRGAGDLSRETAKARVLHEKAREQAIDNNYQQVENYFEVRQLNRRERNAERGPTPTPEDVLRYSQSRLPERLSLRELDPHAGVIHWPAALMRPEFDEHRARLEQVFQGRSYYNSGIASESYLEIRDETARMMATLQDQVRYMDPTAYVEARRFISSLGYEGRFVAGSDRIASSR
jgi:hypothetical protein